MTQPAGRITEVAIRAGAVLPSDAPTDGALRVVAIERPTEAEIDAVGRRLGIDPRALQRAHDSHLRARAERYGDVRFLSLRPAYYDDEAEQVSFGELQLLVGEDYVVLLQRNGQPAARPLMEQIISHPQGLELGSFSVLHLALDSVVDGYAPVIAGLENDIDEIEDEVFSAGRDPLRRIYQLLREVIAFQRATDPTEQVIAELLRRPNLPAEEHRDLRDAHQLALHASERAATFRSLLESVLNVNLALQTKILSEISIDQNEQMKKISSWAAILLMPTLVGSIYGMNFRHMPELYWMIGYPLALGLMVVLGGSLYVAFKRRDWL